MSIADDVADLEKRSDLYFNLLFAVRSKFPNETRHETALRYIREAESAGLRCSNHQVTENSNGN
ncbi:MAG: hypothetical protein GY763_01760 [Gammaproteobacteria bacterium]|nr:hypothetical protein [Gammaproteobacteria bacterium]